VEPMTLPGTYSDGWGSTSVTRTIASSRRPGWDGRFEVAGTVRAGMAASFGRCQPGWVVDITGSDGQWGPGQSQWTMPGQGLAPASSFFGPGGGSGGGNLPNMQDQCSPGPTQSDSGRSAAAITRSSVRVATGTAGGLPWSLWASRGSPGVVSVEQGGLVVNGRWYGMCPGAPNPAEFELLNAGSVGLIYGYRRTLAPTRSTFPRRYRRRRCSASGAGRSSSVRCPARPATTARSCSTL
jgi:hypothetical protein